MSKFSRGLRQLREAQRRLKPGTVPGALVDSTTGGVFIRQIKPRRGRQSSGDGLSKWH